MLTDQLLADELSDVLSKAGFTGVKSKFPLPVLASKCGLNLKGLQQLARGTFLTPPTDLPAGIHRVHMPYLDFSVNAWIYQAGTLVTIIDTGQHATDIIAKLEALALTPTNLLITHSDPDHVGGLEALMEKYPHLTPAVCEQIETGGHCDEHWSYYFPEGEVCFCGDALFAGSMGRPNVGYERSLKSVQSLLELPPETLLCSGHGPATTVGREREFNCFSGVSV